MVEATKPKNIPVLVVFDAPKTDQSLKSIPWLLAEFYYNRGLWRPHTLTCIIMEEANRFLRPPIVFYKRKAHQLNLMDVIELNRNLR